MSSFIVLFCGEKWCVVRSVNFFFHLGVRCFGLIFLGLGHHFCYFFPVAAAAVAVVTVAVEGGCDCYLLYRIYYFIIVNILFYCNGYIILL